MVLQLRGLESISDIRDLVGEARSLPRVSKEGIIHLAHSMLVPGKYQPRRNFKDESLEDLASSIRSEGIVQPIVVRPISEKKYEIIAGERRWRAAQKVGLHEVPVIIRNLSERSAMLFSLIENIQREDLNIMEEAQAFKQLQDQFNLTQQEVSEAVGKSRVTVTHTLRLLDLHPAIQKHLYDGKMDRGHAKALFSLEGEQLIFCAMQIVEKGLSVRQAEELVQKMKAGKINDVEKTICKSDSEISLGNKSLSEWSKDLSEKFFSSVQVKWSKKGEWSVIFQGDSSKDLEWLVKTLSKDK